MRPKDRMEFSTTVPTPTAGRRPPPSGLDDLFGLVAYAVIGSITLLLVGMVILMLMGRAYLWRWAVGVALLPSGILGLACLRLIVALAGAALERVRVDQTQPEVVIAEPPARVQEEIRLIPYHGPPAHQSDHRRLDGVEEQDLRYFITEMMRRGWSTRAWLGERMPSGRVLTTFDDYDAFIKVLTKAGIIVDRKERQGGRLVTRDQAEIMRTLGLSPTSPTLSVESG